MKTKSVPKKLISSKLAALKTTLSSEHCTMMFSHLDADYMRMRAKEEILHDGNLELAAAMILLAGIKDSHESKNSKG